MLLHRLEQISVPGKDSENALDDLAHHRRTAYGSLTGRRLGDLKTTFAQDVVDEDKVHDEAYFTCAELD